MEGLIGLIIIVIIVIIIFRFLSSSESNIPKHTETLLEPIPDHQRTKIRRHDKTNAQNTVDTKVQIENFSVVKVEHVIDGDTVIVVKDCNKIKVRLDSIDCPEFSQHWGNTAKFGLIKLIGGRKVRLEEHGVDSYERILGTIHVQHDSETKWVNVNERMVTLGHAWVMRRFYNHLPKHRQDKLNRLENWARSKKVGLWKTSNPIPPWKWRRDG